MDKFLLILDIIGIISFALTGYFVATQKRLDLLGIFLISFITALGGGFIRDISVNKIPFIFTENYPLYVIAITLAIAYFYKFHTKDFIEKKRFIFFDSIGLSAFSMSGALVAIEYNLNIVGIVFLSLITATGGGVLRDISLREIPSILKEDFYGTIAIVLGILMFLLNEFDLINNISMIILLSIGVVSRLLVVKYKISLPKI